MAEGRAPAAAIATVTATIGLLAGPGGAMAQGDTSGAPQKAEVRMTSTLGLPGQAYLPCGTLPSCTTSGTIDLTTTADVPVQSSGGSTHGVGPLPFSSATGSADRSWACSKDGTFESHVEPAGTIPGELEVASVTATPGSNALSVALNTAGDNGNEFPQEIVDRTDGGCNTPTQSLTQTMGLWYFHFYMAHRDEQDDVTNDMVIPGLTYDSVAGVFSKHFERFVNVDAGGNVYPVFEDTRLDVEPQTCADPAYSVKSATASGGSMGLDGMRFFPGQIVQMPPKGKMRLGDGSIVETDEGGSFSIQECETGSINFHLGESIGSFWAHVKKALGGGDAKFNVTTERAVAGVRGTIFEVSYDKAKEKTKVKVTEGEVSLKGINGAKGKVTVRPGEVGVQKGKKAPRIVS